MRLFFLGIIFICTVYQPFAQKVEPKTPEICDFSSYAPIRMHHIPTEAVVRKVEPKYPRKVKAQKLEETVSVKILINENGIVEKACALSGNKVFWREAEKAALKWRFKPKYGLAFTAERLDKVQKRYAFAFISFTFRLRN